LALYFAISFSNDIVEFVYILIMGHFSYDVMCFCIDMNYVMLLISYFLELQKKKKKNPYCTSLFIDITKGSLHMVSEPVRPETWDSLRMF
jgi:hypothetical protein